VGQVLGRKLGLFRRQRVDEEDPGGGQCYDPFSAHIFNKSENDCDLPLLKINIIVKARQNVWQC
jgi:hypothetical protein